MNEQINELRMKAGLKILHDSPYLTAHTAGCSIDPMVALEKFAGLIVQECELVITDQLERDGEPNDEWDRGYVSGMWAATRYMKEHFGVEE